MTFEEKDKKIFCVIDRHSGDVIGRFNNLIRAKDYFFECQKANRRCLVKIWSKEEYLSYMRNLIDNS